MPTITPAHMITPSFLRGVIESRPSNARSRQNYIGTKLLPYQSFPTQKVLWDIYYTENNLAGVYDRKGQAIPGDDVLFSTQWATLADIKVSRHLDPDIARIIRQPGQVSMYSGAGGAPGRVALQDTASEVKRLMGWCEDAIDSQAEYFAMQALTEGQINWPPLDADGNAIADPMPHWNAGMDLAFPFALPAAQNQAATTLVGYNSRNGTQKIWSASDANPMYDLEVINEYMIETHGVSLRGGTVYMSESIMSRLATNAAIIAWFAGVNKEQPGARSFIDVEQLKSGIKSNLGWNLEFYDARWTFRERNAGTKATVQSVPFMSRSKILIVPPGEPVGVMGSSEQMNEKKEWVAGKLPWSYQTPKPPYEIEMGINMTCWPMFSRYEWFVLDVLN